jgi:hypothetical protein
MKKLAIIGTVVAIAALGIVGTAVAKPTASPAPSGMTPAEYHALIVRSEALNQKYGLGQKAEQANLRGQLEEIGAWAVPSTSKPNPLVPAGMTAAEYRALLLRSEALNQKYGLGIESLTLERGNKQRFGSGNPLGNVEVAPSTSTDSTGVQWDTVGIGMGALLGFAALVGTALFSVRHRGHLGTS